MSDDETETVNESPVDNHYRATVEAKVLIRVLDFAGVEVNGAVVERGTTIALPRHVARALVESGRARAEEETPGGEIENR